MIAPVMQDFHFAFPPTEQHTPYSLHGTIFRSVPSGTTPAAHEGVEDGDHVPSPIDNEPANVAGLRVRLAKNDGREAYGVWTGCCVYVFASS
jgi:hypothetical protein